MKEMNSTTEKKKLSLRRVTVKDLSVRTGVMTGKPACSACTHKTNCVVSGTSGSLPM